MRESPDYPLMLLSEWSARKYVYASELRCLLFSTHEAVSSLRQELLVSEGRRSFRRKKLSRIQRVLPQLVSAPGFETIFGGELSVP